MKTFNVDDKLFKEAKVACGATTDTPIQSRDSYGAILCAAAYCSLCGDRSMTVAALNLSVQIVAWNQTFAGRLHF